MQPHDLEVGPIENTFEILFKSIGTYFHVNPIAPEGRVVETDLSGYTQEQLHSALTSSLDYYGFDELPSIFKITIDERSKVTGIHRSDNITTYTEVISKDSFRTYNFYNNYGPEKLKASFYSFDNIIGEEVRGILTMDDKWYLRYSTKLGFLYYLRMERAKSY